MEAWRDLELDAGFENARPLCEQVHWYWPLRFNLERSFHSKKVGWVRWRIPSSALSTFDFRVAKLVKSFGLSENHRKS